MSEEKLSEKPKRVVKKKPKGEAILPYISKSDKEIKELALDLFNGRIFVDRQIPKGQEDLIMMIFMPLVFSGEELGKWMKKNNIDLIYGRMTDTMPRSINGYPIFDSIAFLDKADTVRLFEKHKEISDLIDNI
jgi:hypothetical protein